jgi:hypothetical protein
MEVVDPRGERWTVSREWFGLPGWTRAWSRRPELRSLDLPAIVTAADSSGALIAVVFGVVAIVIVLVVLVLILLPVFVLLIGALVAAFALAARLLSIATWTVRAQGETETLMWRVRGLLKSRRAMRTVAGAPRARRGARDRRQPRGVRRVGGKTGHAGGGGPGRQARRLGRGRGAQA